MRRCAWLSLALALGACGSASEDEALEDLPVVDLDDAVDDADDGDADGPPAGVTRPAPIALRHDERAWTRGEASRGRTLIEGGWLVAEASGGDPVRLQVGRAREEASEITERVVLDPSDGRTVFTAAAVGVWLKPAGVFVEDPAPADATFAFRRAVDGERFTVRLRLPDGGAPTQARLSVHPDADRVWFRAVDGDGRTRVARLAALEDAELTLEDALPATPGLARYDASAHRFEVVFPGEPSSCALAAFGEATCRRRGAWRGEGRMSEIPLADGWLLVQRDAGHRVARTAGEGESVEETELAAGCPGYGLIGALGAPPRVAYQCFEADPPVVRVWSPEAHLEVPYPEGEEPARFYLLDLRVPVLQGPGFQMATPRRTWIDLERMRVLEGPPLLGLDDLLGPGRRYVGVRRGEGDTIRLVLVDVAAGTYEELPALPCEGSVEYLARGARRSALRCVTSDAESFATRTTSSIVIDDEARRVWTTTDRVEAVLDDDTVVASDRLRDGATRARRLFTLELAGGGSLSGGR